MQKLLIMAMLLATLLTIKVSEAAVTEDRAYFPPVIMYHDIKLMPLNNFDVTLKDFRKQLKWLKDNGYKTLSMEEFIDTVTSGKAFPKNSVLLTFDDGYSDSLSYALPELKSRNMKATFFINRWYIGKKAKGYPYITESELKSLADEPLISLGSHTTSHEHLDKLSPERLAFELSDTKAYLEELTGKPVLALSYPFGDYNADVIAATQTAGYEVAFAVQDRGLFDQPARFSIPRIYMGLALSANNQALFKKYVRNYSKMPPEAFIDRWQPLNQ
ncbi:MAG: polysaccharide deacetylase family protein [Selenomonadaceae bacterium]|nr:polysaccharide deacetylase family protein [Selenomonadaceae bacterium]